jgi:hypothetical protein
MSNVEEFLERAGKAVNDAYSARHAGDPTVDRTDREVVR